jgi:hypothetical protein
MGRRSVKLQLEQISLAIRHAEPEQRAALCAKRAELRERITPTSEPQPARYTPHVDVAKAQPEPEPVTAVPDPDDEQAARVAERVAADKVRVTERRRVVIEETP